MLRGLMPASSFWSSRVTDVQTPRLEHGLHHRWWLIWFVLIIVGYLAELPAAVTPAFTPASPSLYLGHYGILQVVRCKVRVLEETEPFSWLGFVLDFD